MTTLNPERSHNLCKKILTSSLIAAFISLTPTVNADPVSDVWYSSIQNQYHLQSDQMTNLIIANQYSTRSKHPEVLQALMLQESGAHQSVKSNHGCHGILQIMTSTAISVINTVPDIREKYFGNTKVTPSNVTLKLKNDVVFSVEVADAILAHAYSFTQDLNRVLYGYNRGERYMLTAHSPGKSTYVASVNVKIKSVTVHVNSAIQQHNDVTDSTTPSEIPPSEILVETESISIV